MKRLARFAPLLVVPAALTITALIVHWRGAQYRWQALPGGGEVRVLAVTHGREHTVTIRGPAWRARIKAAWLERSGRALTASPNTAYKFGTSTPSVAFTLEGRDVPPPDSGAPSPVLVLPDGQVFRARTSSGGSIGQGWRYTYSFPVVPARPRSLRLVIDLNGSCCELTARNPARRTDLPVWKGEPLPQTRRHGDVALTLRAINFSTTAHPRPTPRRAHPAWTITRDGEPADEGYRVTASYADAAGNVSDEVGLFSEPVWKVRATVSRTDRFPFTDEEARWLGTVNPAGPELRTAPAHTLLPLTDDGAAGRLKLIGLFGAGQFEIKDHVVTLVGTPGPVAEDAAADWDAQRDVFVVRLDRPALLILDEQPTEKPDRFDVQLIRDERGAVVRLSERGLAFRPGERLRVLDSPEKPVRFGVARSDPFQLEFFIPAPAPPPTAASSTSAR